MTPINTWHRSMANYVLEWFQNAGEKIKNEYKDMEVFARFFRIGKKTKRWDDYTFIDDTKVIIGWNDVPYAFMVDTKENIVQRINHE